MLLIAFKRITKRYLIRTNTLLGEVAVVITYPNNDMDNVANALKFLCPGHIFGNNSKYYAHTRHSSLLSDVIKDPDNKRYNYNHCYDVSRYLEYCSMCLQL